MYIAQIDDTGRRLSNGIRRSTTRDLVPQTLAFTRNDMYSTSNGHCVQFHKTTGVLMVESMASPRTAVFRSALSAKPPKLQQKAEDCASLLSAHVSIFESFVGVCIGALPMTSLNSLEFSLIAISFPNVFSKFMHPPNPSFPRQCPIAGTPVSTFDTDDMNLFVLNIVRATRPLHDLLVYMLRKMDKPTGINSVDHPLNTANSITMEIDWFLHEDCISFLPWWGLNHLASSSGYISADLPARMRTPDPWLNQHSEIHSLPADFGGRSNVNWKYACTECIEKGKHPVLLSIHHYYTSRSGSTKPITPVNDANGDGDDGGMSPVMSSPICSARTALPSAVTPVTPTPSAYPVHRHSTPKSTQISWQCRAADSQSSQEDEVSVHEQDVTNVHVEYHTLPVFFDQNDPSKVIIVDCYPVSGNHRAAVDDTQKKSKYMKRISSQTRVVAVDKTQFASYVFQHWLMKPPETEEGSEVHWVVDFFHASPAIATGTAYPFLELCKMIILLIADR